MSVGKIKHVGHTYVLSSGTDTIDLRKPSETKKELEAILDLNNLVLLLRRSERDTANPDVFEESVAKCFRFLGYEAKHLGGSGKADVLLVATLGSGAYRVAIEAKTSTTGIVDDARINWFTLEDHRRQNDAKYSAVVGPGFESSRVQERATKTGTTLLSTKTMEGSDETARCKPI